MTRRFAGRLAIPLLLGLGPVAPLRAAGDVACWACGAAEGPATVRDGRAFCPRCASTLVESRVEAESLYRHLLDTARRRLGLVIRDAPRLVLAPEVALRRRAGVRAADGISGLYVRGGHERPSIHVLSPLPRARLTSVLAHEIAHAWQAENCPDEQGRRLREGFAEWVAWRLLEGREACAGERRVIEARTDVYGQGFRVFAELQARPGGLHPVAYARAARAGE